MTHPQCHWEYGCVCEACQDNMDQFISGAEQGSIFISFLVQHSTLSRHLIRIYLLIPVVHQFTSDRTVASSCDWRSILYLSSSPAFERGQISLQCPTSTDTFPGAAHIAVESETDWTPKLYSSFLIYLRNTDRSQSRTYRSMYRHSEYRSRRRCQPTSSCPYTHDCPEHRDRTHAYSSTEHKSEADSVQL